MLLFTQLSILATVAYSFYKMGEKEAEGFSGWQGGHIKRNEHLNWARTGVKQQDSLRKTAGSAINPNVWAMFFN